MSVINKTKILINFMPKISRVHKSMAARGSEDSQRVNIGLNFSFANMGSCSANITALRSAVHTVSIASHCVAAGRGRPAGGWMFGGDRGFAA